MKVHQLVQVEPRLPQHLHLPDVDVVQRVDAHARLLDVLGDGVGDQLVDHLLQVTGRHLAGDDVHHLLADLTHL